MTNKKTPHVHAEVIHAFADGEQVQVRNPRESFPKWRDAKYPDFDEACEYRIKPQAPETRMTDDELCKIWDGVMPSQSKGKDIVATSHRAIANAAIARAIADGDVVLSGDRDERDFNVALAVKKACVMLFACDQRNTHALDNGIDLQAIIRGLK